ncbi:hypothetical protein ACI2K4_24585 [Micromonospora sp. NPDC050397]|uniref:hypothetical protein n=1 Tax=Micromonospora sp. NPDC050397 TaxID=3364279 RepID=UPI00384D37C2
MRRHRSRAVGSVLLLLALATGGCGGGLDDASRKACDDTGKLMVQFDEFKGNVEELRAVYLGALRPKLEEIAAPASGDVKSSIQRLADVIREADLESSSSITILRPKFAAFDPRFAEARQDFVAACE